MAKAYWVVCYRSISDPAARDAYTKLAVPAVLASGARFLTRGLPAKTYEGGIVQRTALIEFDSVAQVAAMIALATGPHCNAAARDLRGWKALTVEAARPIRQPAAAAIRGLTHNGSRNPAETNA